MHYLIRIIEKYTRQYGINKPITWGQLQKALKEAEKLKSKERDRLDNIPTYSDLSDIY